MLSRGEMRRLDCHFPPSIWKLLVTVTQSAHTDPHILIILKNSIAYREISAYPPPSQSSSVHPFAF